MRWFGESWGSHVCMDNPHAETPVGQNCLWCDEAIEAGDRGVLIPYLGDVGGWEDRPQHIDCAIRSIIGGLNHQKGTCTCCGGSEPPDPPQVSKREAARLATAFWQAVSQPS